MKNKKIIIICVLILFISCMLFVVYIKNDNSSVLVNINGDKIYKYEIDSVLSQLSKEDINENTPKEIINNTIYEIVVSQFGKENGLILKDNEFNTTMSLYRSNYKSVYARGVKLYGEKSFINGVKRKIMFNKTKEYILKNCLNISKDVSLNEINDYIQKHSIGEIVDESLNNKIKDAIIKERVDKSFDEFVDSLIKNSNIIYY